MRRTTTKAAIPDWDLWIKELVTSFHYHAAQLRPSLLGLEIYADAAQKDPFALLVNGVPESEAFAQAGKAGFQIVVTGDVEQRKVFYVGSYGGEFTALPDLPSWMTETPRAALLPKSVVLLPFKAEDEARRAFQRCHDAIYKESANDPAATFDLLLNVIAAKILDERSAKETYRFALISGEDPSRTAKRLRSLLVEAGRWLGANVAGGQSIPSLSGNLATRIVSILQNYSFTLTARCATTTDLLGTAYESIVGSTFRGELGSYFTPRTIADFIARMLEVRKGRVFDPACGSAGLLLAVMRLARTVDGIEELEVFGNDINPRMVRAARLNFLLHDLDPENVLHGDGLQVDRMVRTWFERDVPEGVWWEALRDGPFDCVVANPPFAGHESDAVNLSRIESARRSDGGAVRSLNRTIPFLEAIVAALAQGGVAGLVIPTSILNAEEDSFVRFRELLIERAEILAIIGLPEKAFVHTDSGVHGALMFLRRVARPRSDYPVFVDWARNLGYDRLGRYKRESDFPTILERFRANSWPPENTFQLSALMQYGRLDPAYIRAAAAFADSNLDQETVPLTSLLEVRDARFRRASLKDDVRYRYFEVSDANVETGAIETIHETTGFELRKKGRIKLRVEAGDLLLPNHRDSLIAKSAPTGRSVVPVGVEHDGVLTTDRFIVLRPRVNPLLLALILNSAGVRRQIVAQCRGAASLDIRERTLAAVRVPKRLIEGESPSRLIELGEAVARQRASLRETISLVNAELADAFGGSPDFRPESALQL